MTKVRKHDKRKAQGMIRRKSLKTKKPLEFLKALILLFLLGSNQGPSD